MSFRHIIKRGIAGIAFGASVGGAMVWYSQQQQSFYSRSSLFSAVHCVADDGGNLNCEQKFNKFASIVDSNKQRYMSFDDFVLSFCRKDGTAAFEASTIKGAQSAQLRQLFQLFDANGDGRLSFGEYCVLYLVLTTPAEYFQRAFTIFQHEKRNVNGRSKKANTKKDKAGSVVQEPGAVATTPGDGEASSAASEVGMSAGEFTVMMRSLVGDPHMQLDLKRSGLVQFFFGENRDRLLQRQQFTEITEQLRREVLRAEFQLALVQQRSQPNADTISLGALRRLLYQRQPSAQQLARQQKAFQEKNKALPAASAPSPSEEESSSGTSSSKIPELSLDDVTESDFLDTVKILQSANRWSRACDLYRKAEKDCDFQAFRRSLSAYKVQVSDRAAEIFFRVFDVDLSGTLDPEEISAIGAARASAFAKFQPNFKQPKRNPIQEWFYCMQQKEE